jgi:hypothetical protein
MLSAVEANVTTEYEEYLTKWVTEVLSVPTELLNSLPICPYARKAILNDQVKFIRTSNYVADINQLLVAWDDQYHALLFVCDNDVDPVKFAEDVTQLNKQFLPQDLVLLEDHVGIDEPFHGIKFNNGKYNIIIVQRLHSINEASRSLERSGYYENWSDDLYDDVVRWRFEANGPSSS